MLLEKAKNPKEKKEKKEKKGKKEKKERKLPPSPRSPAAVTARKMAGWDKEHVPSLAAAEQLVEGVRQHLSYRYYPLKVFLDQIPDTVTARDLFQIFAGLGGSGEVEAVVVLEAMRARGRRQRTSDVRETGPRTGTLPSNEYMRPGLSGPERPEQTLTRASLLSLKHIAIIQLGDKATYDRALSDDVRMFGICWQVGNREIDRTGHQSLFVLKIDWDLTTPQCNKNTPLHSDIFTSPREDWAGTSSSHSLRASTVSKT
jgi:hypothetical protein